MKWKYGFKLLSRICLILFYIIALLSIFTTTEHITRIWFSGSSFEKSFGIYEPIFTYFDLSFNKQPELFNNTSFLILSFVSTTAFCSLLLLFLWFLQKLLMNIYKENLFLYENVSLISKLGYTILFLGTLSTYTEEQLALKVLDLLKITNAQISLSTGAYLDTIIGGVVLLLIASALKFAVSAVEENKQTI
ncbi:hypothetical protein [Anaerobacillus sp. 1_MG-2023]|uniref:hypothetical protein n=1 Tax=Bacillales TaxID=1385 RepID=UPI0026E41265|nr:hypothetical protein [Anaerobacillus sp. 1_MG-2023]MDO6654344.1 hypothetical protein [Anaerobacillus sp. 1_MG-2023]